MRPLNISPSQLKSWKMCPRKWAHPILGDLPREPPEGPALVGDRLHAMAEAWLEHGTPPDLDERIEYTTNRGQDVVRYPGRILEAGLHMLPTPSPELEIECEARFTSQVTTYKGRIDLRYTDGLPVVHDHKSTGSLDYALTSVPGSVNRFGEPNYLGNDEQALIYGADALMRFDAEQVRLDWAYFETKSTSGGRHRSRKVSIVLDRAHVSEGMKRLDKRAALIQGVYQNQHRLTVLDLPPNPNACSKFGGCEHAERCNLTEDEKLRGLFMNTDNLDPQVAKLLADLKAGAGPTAIGNGAPPPPPPAAVEAPNPWPAPPPPPPVQASAPPPPPPPPERFTAHGFAGAPPPLLSAPARAEDNYAQAYLRAKGASERQIANAAEPAPDGLGGLYGASLDREGSAIGVDRLTEEGDHYYRERIRAADPINPPEAPPNSPEQPANAPPKEVAHVDRATLDTTDRAAVKAYLLQEGLVDSGCRFGLPRLLELLPADDAPAEGPAVDLRVAIAAVRAALDVLEASL